MTTRLACAFSLLLGFATAGCYSPNVPTDPTMGGFYCNATLPDCPDGFTCDLNHCMSGGGKCNCVSNAAGGLTVTAGTAPVESTTAPLAPASRIGTSVDETAAEHAVAVDRLNAAAQHEANPAALHEANPAAALEANPAAAVEAR